MGFFRDLTDLLYKHRSDHTIAPMETLSAYPPTPQPCTFHVLSSSSSTMSINHMIMDEFVSLQGFITIGMDANINKYRLNLEDYLTNWTTWTTMMIMMSQSRRAPYMIPRYVNNHSLGSFNTLEYSQL
ncbi:hypothetical protein Lal_00031472 [Lupinus albus]|nr:hypothetical protein Lal_00031472 [Lupinus albus]